MHSSGHRQNILGRRLQPARGVASASAPSTGTPRGPRLGPALRRPLLTARERPGPRIRGVPDAFYEPDGEGYRATELTRGPWDPDSQHAGPPAALIGHAIESLEDAAGFHIGRITFEILGAVPIGQLRPSAEIVRPGRGSQLVEAGARSRRGGRDARPRLADPRPARSSIPEELLRSRQATPGPEAGRDARFFPTGHDVGYHTAMEYRFLEGAFLEPGPAKVWMRMRQPLIDGGGDHSPAADPHRRRLGQRRSAPRSTGAATSSSTSTSPCTSSACPAGEWVGLDAITLPQRERRRHRRHRCSSTRPAASAARCRRCSSRRAADQARRPGRRPRPGRESVSAMAPRPRSRRRRRRARTSPL